MIVFGCYAALYLAIMNSMILDHRYVTVSMDFVAMNGHSTLGVFLLTYMSSFEFAVYLSYRW